MYVYTFQNVYHLPCNFSYNLLVANISANACSITNPCSDNQGHCQSDDECKGVLKCGYSNCPAGHEYHQQSRCCYDYCSKWLDMENGTLMSPWFPNYYPREIGCQTLITVGMTIAGPRTITLEFLHFKVSSTVISVDISFTELIQF